MAKIRKILALLLCLSFFPGVIFAESIFVGSNNSSSISRGGGNSVIITSGKKKNNFRIVATDEEVAAAWARVREKYVASRLPIEGFSAEMPSRYDHLIKEATARYEVDFYLIKAIIKVESDFNPRAVSSKGAKGLMQIMPQNYANLGIRDPFNVRESIYGGTQHFKKELQCFNNDRVKAIAAYNAGASAVERHNGIPPFTETQVYVRKVVGYYQALKNAQPKN